MKQRKVIAILAVILVLALMVSVLAACNRDDKNKNTVVIGSSTELSGDFRWPGFGGSSAGAADQDISKLTNGYATMERDRAGSYTWNATAVKSHTQTETESGTYLITIEINPGLTMSNGEEVKAANYLAYILAMSTVVSKEAGYSTAGQSFVGYDAFTGYDGTNEGQHYVVSPAKEATKDEPAKPAVMSKVPASKVFKGVRLLGDYKFSLEVSTDYYPFYFANTYGAVSPYDLKLVLGDGVTVKDDGNGAYLDGNWYAKADGKYSKAAHIKSARYDTSTYAFTGPYTIANWNKTSREATLKLNPQFKGTFDKVLPSIPTIVYRKVVTATQINDLKSGGVDIIMSLTGGEEVNAALAAVKAGGFAETHYDRAGYGKLQFDCDFGPTMFDSVRRAVAYCFDRTEFANTFCGGYGAVVSAPYSKNFAAVTTLGDDLTKNLNEYASSLDNVKKELTAGGWTYNSKGEDKGANWTKGEGVDSVRYKKLSAGEYGLADSNKTYTGVTSDGANIKTVKIGDDYYMPLVINWMSSENNPVSALLTTMLKEAQLTKDAGILITKTEVGFPTLLANIYREGEGYSGTPTFSMYNLATGWNSEIYDCSFNWIDNSNKTMYDQYFQYSSNKLSDPYDKAFSWWTDGNKGLSYAEAKANSGGNLGMNYISMAMVYSVKPGDTAEYNKWFKEYMVRWNELLPDIPLYSNIYYDVYNSKKLSGLKTSPFWGAAEELVYQKLANQD